MNFELEVAVKWIAALLAIGAIFAVTFVYIIPSFTNQVQAREGFFCKVFGTFIRSCNAPSELKAFYKELRDCKNKNAKDCPGAYQALFAINDKQVKVTNYCMGAFGQVECVDGSKIGAIVASSKITLQKEKEELGEIKQDFVFRLCDPDEKGTPSESLTCATCPYFYTLFLKDSKPQLKLDTGLIRYTYALRNIGVNGKYLCAYYE